MPVPSGDPLPEILSGQGSPQKFIDSRLATNSHIFDDFSPPSSTTLTQNQAAHLKVCGWGKRSDPTVKDHHDDHHAGHGHGEKDMSIITALAAALINYLLMFGLCCAYGMIMFDEEHNSQHRALGVKMNLCTAFFMGIICCYWSGVPVAVGGPDLNPVVFLGSFVATMAPKIASSCNLDYPEATSRRLNCAGDYSLSGIFRQLGGGGGAVSTGPVWCSAEWCHAEFLDTEVQCMANCEDYHAQLIATTIFATAVSSGILGLCFFSLGKFKMTRYVAYVPTSVQEAFLSCIGYKVFKYALSFCEYDIIQFVPAACIGVPLYFIKAYHIGNPAVVMPLGFLVPLGVFYIIIFSQGMSIDEARYEGRLYFPEMKDQPFYNIWLDGIGNYGSINVAAWLETIPNLVVMIIVCILDCLLKISSTENKLPVKCDKNWETQLYGASNAIMVACGASVGYMQLKFNVIAYGVMGNAKDRRGGAFYAIFCGLGYFWTIVHFNFLPRFFLSSLLFFAGAGFVCENLWGSRKFLTFGEWIEILIILGVFIFSGSLLAAVATGGFLTGIGFIRKYARVPAISNRPLTGAELTTNEFRPLLAQRTMKHISDSWLLVIKLKGFVFFASVHKVMEMVMDRFVDEHGRKVPEYRRLKFVVFDCAVLDGMDVSAAKAIKKLKEEATALDVKVIFSSVSAELAIELATREIIADGKGHADWYPDLDSAVTHVDDLILKYCRELQRDWLKLHPSFEQNLYQEHTRSNFEPFNRVLDFDSGRFGCPWLYCTRMRIKRCQTVLWEPGEANGVLYLVHSGAVGVFQEVPEEIDDIGEHEKWASPATIYRHGSFLNCESLAQMPNRLYAVALEDGWLVCWKREQWSRMTRQQPAMLQDILRAVMRQSIREMVKDSGLQPIAQAAVTMRPDDSNPVGPLKDVSPNTPADIQTPASGPTTGPTKKQKLDRQASKQAMQGLTGGSTEPGPSSRTSMKRRVEAARDKALGLSSIMPEELLKELQGLEAAHALGALGLFDKVTLEATVDHPAMPPPLIKDLRVAFQTYQERVSCKIAWQDVQNAFRFAGIFTAHLVQSPDHADLSEAEFLWLAQEVSMARLSVKHVKTINEAFDKYDIDKSGTLEANELAAVFRETLHPFDNISVEVVDGIAAGWKDQVSGVGIVNRPRFIGIMSRYLAKHDHFWCLLKGMLEVMACDEVNPATGVITIAQLLQASQSRNTPLTTDRAKELIWAANWGRNADDVLDWAGLLSAITTCFDRPGSALPETPVLAAGAPGKEIAPLPPLPAGFDPTVLVTTFRSTGKLVIDQHDNSALDDEEAVDQRISAQESEEEREAQKVLEVEEGQESIDCKSRMYDFLEKPESSQAAAMGSLIMSVMILVSVLTLVLQPMISPEPQELEHQKVWGFLEGMFTCIFLSEYLARLYVADAFGLPRLAFVLLPANLCDLCAIMPFFIELAVSTNTSEMRLLRIIRMTRLSRMARVARLANKSPLAAPVSMVLVVIWGIYLKH